MPDDIPSANRERLPIKLILPKQGEESKVRGGGGKPKEFRTVDASYRENLLRGITKVSLEYFAPKPQLRVAPMRVRILSQAIAKSHRPEQVFSSQTCPIIGAGSLGELFVKATPDGLSELARVIQRGRSKQVLKEISSIKSIEPITPAQRLKGVNPKDLYDTCPSDQTGHLARVQLFKYGTSSEEVNLLESFTMLCREHSIIIENAGYSQSSSTFSVLVHSADDIEILSKAVGIRSIVAMPSIRALLPKSMRVGAQPVLPTRTAMAEDMPIVAVVDSGVSDTITALSSWILGSEQFVAQQYRNTEHGSFVAGLVCFGGILNPGIPGVDQDPCAILDIQVLPNCDSSKGQQIELLTEQSFLVDLEEALKRHSNACKVWNLSLGLDTICSLDAFSPLAVELDNLQEKYQVSFVISAGNYDKQPLLSYPRKRIESAVGRITVPGDSILGITVGSLSHVDIPNAGLKKHEPSAFSRHGAGPNHIIKPDLVHYGGCCSTDMKVIHGVQSLAETGVVQGLGTSYSTPLVSRALAQIYHRLTPEPSPVLARALLTHHARDPRSGLRVPDGDEDCYGFGVPALAPYCLECTPYTSTLVFEDALRPGYFLEWDDFPYPSSLRQGDRYFGEVWMTIAYAPARGPQWGSEYCESHVDAHFGVYKEKINVNTGELTLDFKGLVPPEHTNPGLLYESYQVAKLRKWAPVRTYHGRLPAKGEKGTRWRLKVQLLSRHIAEGQEDSRPQPFSLILTISDPQGKAPVYDEMARIVLNRFQSQNLAIRPAVRVQQES